MDSLRERIEELFKPTSSKSLDAASGPVMSLGEMSDKFNFLVGHLATYETSNDQRIAILHKMIRLHAKSSNSKFRLIGEHLSSGDDDYGSEAEELPQEAQPDSKRDYQVASVNISIKPLVEVEHSDTERRDDTMTRSSGSSNPLN